MQKYSDFNIKTGSNIYILIIKFVYHVASLGDSIIILAGSMTLKHKLYNYFYIIFNFLEYFNNKINVRGIKRLSNRLARNALRKR